MFCGLRAWLRRHPVNVCPASPSGKLGVRVHAYVAAVLVVAAGLSATVFVAGELSVERPWLLAVLAGLVGLEHVLSVRLRRRQHGETLAHEEALIVLMAVLLPPAVALLGFAAGALAGQLAQVSARLKAVFNIGQLVGSAALAFLVVGAVAPASASDPRRVLAALLGVVVFSIANRAAVAGVLALTGASSFRANLSDDLGLVALVWLGTVCVGLLAGLAALAHAWALPFALAAMVVLSVAFSGHARARRERQAQTELVLRLQRTANEKDGIAQRLEESLSRLQSTLESTADGILVVDQSGKIIESNRRFLELWRIPPEIAEEGDDDRALEFAVGQLSDPEAFLAKVRELSASGSA